MADLSNVPAWARQNVLQTLAVQDSQNAPTVRDPSTWIPGVGYAEDAPKGGAVATQVSSGINPMGLGMQYSPMVTQYSQPTSTPTGVNYGEFNALKQGAQLNPSVQNIAYTDKYLFPDKTQAPGVYAQNSTLQTPEGFWTRAGSGENRLTGGEASVNPTSQQGLYSSDWTFTAKSSPPAGWGDPNQSPALRQQLWNQTQAGNKVNQDMLYNSGAVSKPYGGSGFTEAMAGQAAISAPFIPMIGAVSGLTGAAGAAGSAAGSGVTMAEQTLGQNIGTLTRGLMPIAGAGLSAAGSVSDSPWIKGAGAGLQALGAYNAASNIFGGDNPNTWAKDSSNWDAAAGVQSDAQYLENGYQPSITDPWNEQNNMQTTDPSTGWSKDTTNAITKLLGIAPTITNILTSSNPAAATQYTSNPSDPNAMQRAAQVVNQMPQDEYNPLEMVKRVDYRNIFA